MNLQQCQGPGVGVGRRELLRTGLVGFSGLTLPGLFQARAETAPEADDEQPAVILVPCRRCTSVAVMRSRPFEHTA